jgi:hypothetical protein
MMRLGAALHLLDREIPIELNAIGAGPRPGILERLVGSAADRRQPSLGTTQVQPRYQVAECLIRSRPAGGVSKVGVGEVQATVVGLGVVS